MEWKKLESSNYKEEGEEYKWEVVVGSRERERKRRNRCKCN